MLFGYSLRPAIDTVKCIGHLLIKPVRAAVLACLLVWRMLLTKRSPCSSSRWTFGCARTVCLSDVHVHSPR
ncbi:hypothetical protein C8T65DRAFT_651842 [Cerioporus squamosus]|nr:hypothetical protein C8T65DRAFT_651842 [Cerioporus squamosus]